MRTCLLYLPADQRVPQSLQQRLDLGGRWKLLFGPRADRNAQQLLRNEATASTLADSVHASLGEKLRPRRSDEAANLHLDEDVRGQRSSVGTVWGTGRRPRASMFSLRSGRPLSLLSHHVQPPVTEVQSRWAPHLLHHAIVPALPLSSN